MRTVSFPIARVGPFGRKGKRGGPEKPVSIYRLMRNA
jgi:hypothetical protein